MSLRLWQLYEINTFTRKSLNVVVLTWKWHSRRCHCDQNSAWNNYCGSPVEQRLNVAWGVRSSGSRQSDDDVRNSVFVYGLTALNSVDVSWPYCKSALFEDGWKRSEKLYDRNAGTRLSAAAAAAAGAMQWRLRQQLIDAHSSIGTDYVTYDVTARGRRGKNSCRALPVVYRPEVRRLAEFRSAVSPQFRQVLVWNDLRGPSSRRCAIGL